MTRRDALIAGGAAGAGVFVAACGGKAGPTTAGAASSPVPSTTKGTLIHIPAGSGDFLLPIEVGFHEALTSYGWKFQQLTTPGEGGSAGQAEVKNIEQALSIGPTALAMAIPNGGAGTDVVRRALSQIKYVIVTNQTFQPVQSQLGLSYVGQDVVAAGGVAITKLAQLILAKGIKSGTIIGGNEAPGGAAILARLQGATAALKQFNATNGTNYSLINMPDNATTPATGVETYRAKVSQLGSHLAGIFTLGFDSTGLMPQVGQALGKRPGDIVMGGFDTGPKVSNAIREGWVSFTMDQQFYSQGSLSAWLLWQWVERTQVPPPITNTGAAIVDKSNVDAVAARDDKILSLAKQYGFTA